MSPQSGMTNRSRFFARPWLVHYAPNPTRIAYRFWVHSGREILGRIGPIMRVVRHAAGADPGMAAQWDPTSSSG